MTVKRIIMIVSFAFLLSLPVFCDPISFSLYHQVNVDASLEYKFLDNQGSVISSKVLQIGANEIGGFYATFNTTRQVSVGLRWEPLIRDGSCGSC